MTAKHVKETCTEVTHTEEPQVARGAITHTGTRSGTRDILTLITGFCVPGADGSTMSVAAYLNHIRSLGTRQEARGGNGFG